MFQPKPGEWGAIETPYPSPQVPTALHGGPTKNKLKAVGLVI